jgi:hypothetical protein
MTAIDRKDRNNGNQCCVVISVNVAMKLWRGVIAEEKVTYQLFACLLDTILCQSAVLLGEALGPPHLSSRFFPCFYFSAARPFLGLQFPPPPFQRRPDA